MCLPCVKRGVNVEVGEHHVNAGFSHLYETNFEKADNLLKDYAFTGLEQLSADPVSDIDLRKFNEPDELVNYLKLIADLDVSCPPEVAGMIENYGFLVELPHVSKILASFDDND